MKLGYKSVIPQGKNLTFCKINYMIHLSILAGFFFFWLIFANFPQKFCGQIVRTHFFCSKPVLCIFEQCPARVFG